MEAVDGARSLDVSSEDIFGLECNPCEYEGVTKKAISFCPECTENLCELCDISHRKMKLTRSHRLVSGLKMPPKEHCMKELSFGSILCSCTKNDVSVCCSDHDDLVCQDCKTLNHRKCKSSSIEEMSVSFNSTKTDETFNNVTTLNDKIRALLTSRKDDLCNLAQDINICRENAKLFRAEMNELLDKMEDNTLSDLNNLEIQETKTIGQQIDICELALNKLKSGTGPLLMSVETNHSQRMFVHNMQLAKAVKSLNLVIDEIKEEMYKPHVVFDRNKELTLTNLRNLGTVKCVPTSVRQHGINEMMVHSYSKVIVDLQSDTALSHITGSLFLPSGELILCDKNNRKVKLLDKSLAIKQHIQLTGWPWDVSLATDTEVIITLPKEKCLQYIQVTPSLQLARTLQMDKECRGIVVVGDSIYVSFSDSKGGEIRIIDKTGKTKRNIGPYKDGHLMFTQPYYIDVSENGKIFVSDVDDTAVSSKVWCIGCDGDGDYTFTDSSMKCCVGIYVDANENVLLCDWTSHKLHLIIANGKKICNFLSSDDGLIKPYSTSFRQSDRTLVVTCRESEFLLVYTLKLKSLKRQ